MKSFKELFGVSDKEFNVVMSKIRGGFFKNKNNAHYFKEMRWLDNKNKVEYTQFIDQLDKKLLEFGNKINNKIKTWQNQFIEASNPMDDWKEK